MVGSSVRACVQDMKLGVCSSAGVDGIVLLMTAEEGVDAATSPLLLPLH